MLAYLPADERTRLNLAPEARRDERHPEEARTAVHLDMKDNIEVLSRKVGGAPGCCLRVGGHLVCVASPKASASSGTDPIRR